MSGSGRTTPPRRRRGLFHPLGVPGIMARQDFLGQTLFVVVVQVILLLIAISIDLARYFDQVMSMAGAETPARVMILARYLGLRIIDMVTRLLPIAVFVGILSFEIWSILTRRRAIQWISGRNPLRVLGPTLGVGVMFGALQWGLETEWRPQAVLTQAAERLGGYGERYERSRPRKDVWIFAGERLIHSQVRFGPPSELIDVDLYRLDDKGRVREVVRSARAEPTPAAGLWRFHAPTRWVRDPERPAEMRVTPSSIEALVPVPLDPLVVTYLGLPAKYIPDDDLQTIVASHTSTLVTADHRVGIEVRRANTLLPLAMALLATSVSFFAGARRPGVGVLILCSLAGYALHVAARVFVAAGELEGLSPVVAAWAPVTVALAAVPLLVGVAALRHWRA